MNATGTVTTNQASASNLYALMTPARWVEVGRILLTGLVALLLWQNLVPIQLLWLAIAIGLYPLVKTGLGDLIHEHKIGTEIFVTVATLAVLRTLLRCSFIRINSASRRARALPETPICNFEIGSSWKCDRSSKLTLPRRITHETSGTDHSHQCTTGPV